MSTFHEDYMKGGFHVKQQEKREARVKRPHLNNYHNWLINGYMTDRQELRAFYLANYRTLPGIVRMAIMNQMKFCGTRIIAQVAKEKVSRV